MTSGMFVLLSGAFTFGVPMAFAVWELLALPTFGRGGDDPPPDEPLRPLPRPLPDCLLPATLLNSRPVRLRHLEDA